MAVEKFLRGISRFQKHVYPEHQELFERLALGQLPEALFITCTQLPTLPMIELLLGLALIVAPFAWRRGAALATAGLLAVFTAAIAQAVARGISIDCGCFGGAAAPVTVWTIARDVGLLAAAAGLLLLDQPRR